MNTEIYKAIIFDVDGVLINSERPKFDFMKKLYMDFGLKEIQEDEFTSIAGRPVKFYFEETVDDQDTRDRLWKEFQDDYLNNLTDFMEPIPITVDFIKKYQGNKKLAIASNGLRDVVRNIVKYLNIDNKIEAVLTREDVTKLKPDPEIYQKTAKRIGVDPTKSIVIEDSVAGVKASLSAGSACYIMLNGVNKESDFDGLNYAGFIRNGSDYDQVK